MCGRHAPPVDWATNKVLTYRIAQGGGALVLRFCSARAILPRGDCRKHVEKAFSARYFHTLETGKSELFGI